ncbi:glycosyltransferase family 4 protein [Sulfurovum sp.]|uniref:glycosyltransferase family 4 protein n=1 Tax=Sulfurovum sp. TaxID=1969726 RepID=UPI002867E5AB|nr:glycosyltransferase family 4 protein [Sulfurovum sp.]
MKNICFFSGDISRSGGTERVTTVIANELSSKDYNVFILSVLHGQSSFFKLQSDIKLFSLHMEGKSSNFSNIATIKKLHHFVKEHTIDYIIDVDIILSFYSVPATIGTSTKVISWEHFHYFINVGGFMQRFKRAIAQKLASKFSNYIITLTEKDRQQYLENLSSKAEIVAINNPATIKHSQKANLQSKTVLAVGRLTSQKGFDLLLKSWKIVVEDHGEWTLRIVGSGKDEEMLKKLVHYLSISNMVEFIPNTKNVEKNYMDAAMYVMSSRFEGLPLVLLEAKSYGLPIVSFDCDCGPSDIVRDGVDGILVEKENIDKLADGLIVLIENEGKRYMFGENALEDHRFDIDNIVSQWQKILK